MILHYYYNQQLKKFIVGFANVFAGLQVKSGTDGCGNITTMEVPIRYGSADRVVAAIGGSNTQNKQHTLPMMACYMTGIELAPDRFKGVDVSDRRSYLEQGGVFPDDVKSIHRVMPIPFNMIMELSIYASNTDQLYQMLEQILMLTNYELQLQFNDAPFDWSRVTSLALTGVTNEETYPTGVERRILIWSFTYTLPIWLSPPIEIRNDIIRTITLRLSDVSQLHLDEVGEDGELLPFTGEYLETQIEGQPDPADPAEPSSNVVPPPEHYDPSLEACRTPDHNQGGVIIPIPGSGS